MPLVLYHQFRYFFNMFFLVIALSQLVDMLKVGFLFTYVAPLLLVLGFTLFK
jgi:phospholipid-translocating ATPase